MHVYADDPMFQFKIATKQAHLVFVLYLEEDTSERIPIQISYYTIKGVIKGGQLWRLTVQIYIFKIILHIRAILIIINSLSNSNMSV